MRYCFSKVVFHWYFFPERFSDLIRCKTAAMILRSRRCRQCWIRPQLSEAQFELQSQASYWGQVVGVYEAESHPQGSIYGKNFINFISCKQEILSKSINGSQNNPMLINLENPLERDKKIMRVVAWVCDAKRRMYSIIELIHTFIITLLLVRLNHPPTRSDLAAVESNLIEELLGLAGQILQAAPQTWKSVARISRPTYVWYKPPRPE